MTEQEAVARAAEKYRGEGFAVTLDPDPAALPAELQGRRLALLATHNGTSVAVEVWSRDRVNDLPPTFLPPGWEFDVISLPSAAPDGLPGPGPAATPESTRRLLEELDELLPRGATRARFLVAWAAAEAGMRVAARQAGLDPDRAPPRQLMADLTSAGILSQAQLDRLRQLFAVRNRLIHGVPVDGLDPAASEDLAGVARRLIEVAPVPAG